MSSTTMAALNPSIYFLLDWPKLIFYCSYIQSHRLVDKGEVLERTLK
jgi:hypothetical protein